MLDYELSQVIRVLIPYLGNTLSILGGVLIANMFWKSRIHRFSKAEVIQTLEYQKNKIEQLEAEIRENKVTISDLKGSMKIAKIAALKIMGVTK